MFPAEWELWYWKLKSGCSLCLLIFWFFSCFLKFLFQSWWGLCWVMGLSLTNQFSFPWSQVAFASDQSFLKLNLTSWVGACFLNSTYLWGPPSFSLILPTSVYSLSELLLTAEGLLETAQHFYFWTMQWVVIFKC